MIYAMIGVLVVLAFLVISDSRLDAARKDAKSKSSPGRS
jgi:hypothetical protein